PCELLLLKPSGNRQRRLDFGCVQAKRPNFRSNLTGYFQTGIIDGMQLQLLDVEVLQPVQRLFCLQGTIQAGSAGHDAIDLLKFIETRAQIRGHKKRSELTANNEDAQRHQTHNEGDGNKSDECISNDQPPAEPPEQAASDEHRKPPQVVNAASYSREPEQSPKRCRSTAGEPIHTPQGSPVSQHPHGETRHAVRAVLPQENFEQRSKHLNYRAEARLYLGTAACSSSRCLSWFCRTLRRRP